MVEMSKFGVFGGRDVHRAILSDGGVEIAILSYGCVTQDWRVDGVPVVLGLNSLEDYLAHSKSFGVVAGRVANRIDEGRFTLDGVEYRLPINNDTNHLHGGPGGLGNIVWAMEADDKEVRLSYDSPDGDMGYPGRVESEVAIRLDRDTVTYDMTARPDRPTPINLAQHNYYNLNGSGDVRDHEVFVDSTHYTETREDLIPTGRILAIDDTPMDFRKLRTIAEADPEGLGIDVNTILREGRDKTKPAAVVRGDRSGLTLKLWTEEPGLQLFNAPTMNIPVLGLDGAQYGPFAGLCLEAQHYPDAPNRPEFPSIIYGPDRPYQQTYRVEIS